MACFRAVLPLAACISLLFRGAPAGSPLLDITTTSLPAGQEAVAYSQTLAATGGTPPLTWGIVQGVDQDTAPNSFALTGTGQGFISDDNCWPLALPFAFPFFGQSHTQCFVNTKGVIRFDTCDTDFSPDEAELSQRPMIAVFWGDWITNLDGNPVEDIYVDAAADHVVIRWRGEIYGGGAAVNFSATLWTDGRIELKHGEGNLNGGMVGISSGDGSTYLLAAGSGDPRTNTPDVLFTPVNPLPAGLTLSPSGVLSGTPQQAATNSVSFVVEDSLGEVDTQILTVRVNPNVNQRPVISAQAPVASAVTIPGGGAQLFSVTASDPESAPLTYTWLWDNAPRGGNTASLNVTTVFADAGEHTLECRVTDGLWVETVSWQVTIPSDNDNDGTANALEVELGRDPNNPNDGGAPGSVSGFVTGAALSLEGATVSAFGATGMLFQQDQADANGAYNLPNLVPGHYYLKVEAGGFADERWLDATQRADATAFTVTAGGSHPNTNFILVPGQARALLTVTSSPSGADVYLNQLPTGLTTPATLELGDAPGLADPRLLPYVVTVRRTGSTDPAPVTVDAREAETATVHFALASPPTGSLEITTTPAGASVWLDRADTARGVTPLTLSGVSAGTHLLVLHLDDFLRPRPVEVVVTTGGTAQVTIPLGALSGSGDFTADVRSIPANAPVLINGLDAGVGTDGDLHHLDSAAHAGTGWTSVTHRVLAAHPGFKPAAPRRVSSADIEPAHLLLRHEDTPVVDVDGDALPDAWEAAWDLTALAPQLNAYSDDPDGDGATNGEELRSGTNPVDADSRVGAVTGSGAAPDGSTYTYTFASVPGHYYLIQRVGDLLDKWVTITPVLPAAGLVTSVNLPVPPGATTGYYRALLIVP